MRLSQNFYDVHCVTQTSNSGISPVAFSCHRGWSKERGQGHWTKACVRSGSHCQALHSFSRWALVATNCVCVFSMIAFRQLCSRISPRPLVGGAVRRTCGGAGPHRQSQSALVKVVTIDKGAIPSEKCPRPQQQRAVSTTTTTGIGIDGCRMDHYRKQERSIGTNTTTNTSGNDGSKKTKDGILILDHVNEEAHLGGVGIVDFFYDWTFDDRFYWVGLGTGVLSFTASVCSVHFLTGGFVSYTFLFGLYGNTFIHELGHAEAARRFGRRVRAIYITPLGSGSCVHDYPRNAWQNGVIALAGPVAGGTYSVLCAFGASAVTDWSVQLSIIALWSAYFNGTNLLPFKTKKGIKSDGYCILEAIRQKEVTQEEWIDYGYEFPHDFYDIEDDKRAALKLGYSATVVGILSPWMPF